MADATWNSGSVMGQYLSSLNWEQAQEHAIATCTECGGQYRAAGGPCIHEHPAPKKQEPGPWARRAKLLPAMYGAVVESHGYYAMCGTCREAWQPGHTCIPQPTMAQVQELAAFGSVLRLMDELMGHLADELGVAAPASWEAV